MNLDKTNDEQINYLYKKKELENNSRGEEILEKI